MEHDHSSATDSGAHARERRRRTIALLLVFVLGVSVSTAPWAVPLRRTPGVADGTDPKGPHGFEFARLRYRSEGGEQEAFYFYDGRWWERWETDHPIADRNFAHRLAELSSIRVRQEPAVVDILDEGLFDAPFLYLCDVGWLTLDAIEAERLGEYLRRGGFLWADDFWGYAEWANFERAMAKIAPESTWHALTPEHPLLSMLFPLEKMPQIPARDFARYADHDPPFIHRQPAYDIEVAELRAFTDKKGRIIAIASYNSDVGDGWEREAYGDWFFEKFSSVAYAFGVNSVLYALSH